MAISELDKPEWMPCPRLREAEGADDARSAACRGGCAHYRDRPDSCRSFSCLWLSGLAGIGDEYRPDRCGIVITPTDNPRVVQARQVWPGAARQATGKRLITWLRTLGLRVVVVTPTRTTELQALTVFGSVPS